jgi:hypothetical protein
MMPARGRLETVLTRIELERALGAPLVRASTDSPADAPAGDP